MAYGSFSLESSKVQSACDTLLGARDLWTKLSGPLPIPVFSFSLKESEALAWLHQAFLDGVQQVFQKKVKYEGESQSPNLHIWEQHPALEIVPCKLQEPEIQDSGLPRVVALSLAVPTAGAGIRVWKSADEAKTGIREHHAADRLKVLDESYHALVVGSLTICDEAAAYQFMTAKNLEPDERTIVVWAHCLENADSCTLFS